MANFVLAATRRYSVAEREPAHLARLADSWDLGLSFQVLWLDRHLESLQLEESRY